MARAILHLTVLTMLAVAPQAQRAISPDEVKAVLRERAETHGADVATVLRVADCETGGTWSPWRADGSLLRGSSGELGIGQWLAGGAWYETPGWRDYRYDLRAAYESGDPEALDWDLDNLAWAFGASAPARMRGQWSCYAHAS